MKKTTVVNMNVSKYDVYIGRGSKWGCPFVIGIDGTRKKCINKFKEYLINNKELYNNLNELEGKVLGCFCKPKPCHGDVYCDILNRRNFSL